ncbi:uncharacterized protein LOC110691340 [Chenopodium quinoa]|uniref:uncharacterized protein LOC110691340 n=1 Tax=Chenopodium quinoa TaxID=63459 RepID=UPI000B7917F2|nr:uncharacterized protein LOC110691340 [Chenopodium quinoa]
MAKDDDNSSPPPPSSPEFYPTLTVQYSSWVELFENHVCAYDVLDHIDPKTPRPSNISETLWNRLDAIVKQWIYGTISKDLLETILGRKSTAQQTWDRIKDIFQDNKSTRAVYLETQLNAIHLDAYPNVTAFCQQLKSIYDQLANVAQPISDQKLVLRLVADLNKTDNDTVETMIAQANPLPSFNTARSRLLLEESRRNTDHSNPPSSFFAQQQSSASSESAQQQPAAPGGGRGGRGRGRDGGKAGRGRGRSQGRGGQGGQARGGQQQQSQPSQAPTSQQPSGPIGQGWAQQGTWPNQQYHWPQWATPPAPFPTMGHVQQRPSAQTQHQQAYYSGSPMYGQPMTPTELGSASSTPGLSPPDIGWYMDSGATSHMTHTSGNLLPLFQLSTNNHILVGNGHRIPITGYGHYKFPNKSLALKDVLLAPQIIKNLISVRKFTSDNLVSIDPNGFSVKDLRMGRVITRCNSSGDLYPITTTYPSTCLATSLTTVAPTTWHDA